MLTIICWIILFHPANSQTRIPDSASSLAYAKSLEVYHQALNPPTGLFNGARYYGYPFLFKEGHPYFVSPQPYQGNIQKHGVNYDSVGFIYDLVREQLIVYNQEGDAILIHQEDVTGFSLNGSRFIRMIGIDSEADTAFYAVLYDGNTKLYMRPVKTLQSVIDQYTGELFYIEEHNQYFLKKAGVFFPVTTKKEVLRILKDKKPELQQYIRKEHLSFKKTYLTATLKKLTSYYDSISKH